MLFEIQTHPGPGNFVHIIDDAAAVLQRRAGFPQHFIVHIGIINAVFSAHAGKGLPQQPGGRLGTFPEGPPGQCFHVGPRLNAGRRRQKRPAIRIFVIEIAGISAKGHEDALGHVLVHFHAQLPGQFQRHFAGGSPVVLHVPDLAEAGVGAVVIQHALMGRFLKQRSGASQPAQIRYVHRQGALRPAGHVLRQADFIRPRQKRIPPGHRVRQNAPDPLAQLLQHALYRQHRAHRVPVGRHVADYGDVLLIFQPGRQFIHGHGRFLPFPSGYG